MASIFNEGHFVTVGPYLKHDTNVLKYGLKLYARKHTEDIGYYGTTAKPWTREWFKPSRGEIVVDCGSSVGIFSLIAGKHGATVYAFEANPETFEVLRKNIEINDLEHVIKPYNLGLSNETGEINLYIPGEYTGTSSFDAEWSSDLIKKTGKLKTVKVKTVKLDDILSEVMKIDWLLIDVEGHEIQLLRGTLSTLEKCDKIIIEISNDKKTETIELLQKAGFVLRCSGDPDEKVQYFYFTK